MGKTVNGGAVPSERRDDYPKEQTKTDLFDDYGVDPLCEDCDLGEGACIS